MSFVLTNLDSTPVRIKTASGPESKAEEGKGNEDSAVPGTASCFTHMFSWSSKPASDVGITMC